MTFEEVLDQAIALLQRRGRVTYRTLKRQFQLDDTALEDLTVELIKGVYCEWPRLEDDESIMVAGSYRPLEDAFRIAHTQLIRWISAETQLSLMDTYQLVTQASRSPIANVCDANYTIVAKVPKRFLPTDIPWMNGVHDKMRARAKAVLASRPAR